MTMEIVPTMLGDHTFQHRAHAIEVHGSTATRHSVTTRVGEKRSLSPCHGWGESCHRTSWANDIGGRTSVPPRIVGGGSRDQKWGNDVGRKRPLSPPIVLGEGGKIHPRLAGDGGNPLLLWICCPPLCVFLLSVAVSPHLFFLLSVRAAPGKSWRRCGLISAFETVANNNRIDAHCAQGNTNETSARVT